MLRRTRCPHCKAKLLEGQRIHPECIDGWAEKQAAKAALKAQREARARAKVDRAKTRARARALETPRSLMPKAQKEINRWVRFRDLLAGKGCISCGATFRTAFGGAFDAGHFRSVGSAGHLRFYTPQIRLQCVRCNRDLAGNIVEFRKGLVAERGRDWVESVEGMYWVAKWTADYLRRLIEVARKRANRLEKRLENK